MSYKSARTYRSRKIETGLIDPKEILQTVNDHNSLFDALSIRNIRKYKKDCFYTDLPHSNKPKKKRNLKLSRKTKSRKKASDQKDEVQDVPPLYSPDKSLHVKRISDPFDKLLDCSESIEVHKFEKEKFDPRVNVSSDYSINGSKEKREARHSTMDSSPEFHLSTVQNSSTKVTINKCYESKTRATKSKNMSQKHYQSENMGQSTSDTSEKVFSHKFEIELIDSNTKNTSKNNLQINVNTIRALINCNVTTSPCVSNEYEAISSTPCSKIASRKSIYNFSPIHRNLNIITLDDGNQDNSTHFTSQANISFEESELKHKDSNLNNQNNSNFLKDNDKTGRLKESVLQRKLRISADDINAANSNNLKHEDVLSTHYPIKAVERLNDLNLQDKSVNYKSNTTVGILELPNGNNDYDSESKHPHNYSNCLKNGLQEETNKSRESNKLPLKAEDTATTKFESNTLIDKDTRRLNINQTSVEDDNIYLVNADLLELGKSYNEKLFEVGTEEYVENKENTDINLLHDCLCRRKCDDEIFSDPFSSSHKDSSGIRVDRTCNSEENSLHYFSTIVADNITRRKSPYATVNQIHQRNPNNEEQLNADKIVCSPILHTNWKWQVSQKYTNCEIINCSTNSTDDDNTINECEEVPLNNSNGLCGRVGVRSKNNSLVHRECNVKNCVDNSTLCTELTKLNLIMQSRDKNNFEFIKPSIRNSIVLQPGKKWERSLSIMRRLTMKNDEMLIEIDSPVKGRRFRESIANVVELQQNRESILLQSNGPKKKDTNEIPDVKSRCSTIKIIKEPLQIDFKTSFTALEEEIGFLSESCNDTFIDLSKLSISNVDNSSPLLDTIIDVSDRITSRDVVLRRCNQTDSLPFEECYTAAKLKNCRKIGEGVYGEVFLYRGEDGRARVMKVVPVDGKVRVNGELQKNFDEILSEIIIAMELSALRAPIDNLKTDVVSQGSCQFEASPSIENATDTFNEVLTVNCVYGRYPARLLDLWQLYDESRGSENDSPAVFDEDQQYMILELANGGQDLESFQFRNSEQAYAVFYQVVFALAVAEEVYQFEHRDLHWGNVLCTPTEEKFATYVLRGATYRLPRKGVCATIIDYTLSRICLPLAGATSQATLYNDLGADPTLFEAEGDYQFDIYRLMRERNGNAWKEFEPYTNILWLHYLLDKMITALRYNRVSTKIHKHYIRKLKELKGKILSFESTVDFALNDNEI